MTPTPHRRSGRDIAILLGLAAIPGLLTGCEWVDEARAKGGSGDSVLEMFQPPSPQQAVAWATDPYDANNRYRGLLLISNAPFGGDKIYVEMYELAAADGDPGVRAMAIRALGIHGGPGDVDVLLKSFNDSDGIVRWETARALQRIYAPAAIDALIDHMDFRRETDPMVREASAVALGQYAEPRVAQALFSALNDRKLAVNLAANKSLEILTGQKFAPDSLEWILWYNASAAPFAKQGVYEYPVFHRPVAWWEHIMPWRDIPNEVAGKPAGAPVIEIGAPNVDWNTDPEANGS
jgi:hypothetical protein